MKANEFRLGNLIYYKTEFGELMVYRMANIHAETYLGVYEPIPLTPEILGKCGFSFFCNGYYANKGSFELCIIENEFIYFSIEQQITGKKIEYVHQLQNLYFALTGTELEINL